MITVLLFVILWLLVGLIIGLPLCAAIRMADEKELSHDLEQRREEV